MKRYVVPAIAAALLIGGLTAWYVPAWFHHPETDRPGAGHAADAATVDEATLRRLCSNCHRFPEPEILPRSAWADNVREMAQLPLYGKNVAYRPSLKAIVGWYEQRAPEELPLQSGPARVEADSLPLSMRGGSPENPPDEPAVSHVQFVDLWGDERLELLVSEMRHGLVLLGRPYLQEPSLKAIASVPHPARGEVVDLDQDGRRDVVVANLGSFLPGDHNLGSVEWLKQTGEDRFERVTLADGLGRVADVRAADFDADGDIDLAVAEFGWRATGRVLLLENRTRKWDRPRFEHHVIDRRHGAIHVPVTDLDGDGRPDFLALLAQEHEMVVAYLNRGRFQFQMQEVYQAPHPAWGSSGMQLVDLDRDGDEDVLLTNGDTLDDNRAKPYHAIQWLENVTGVPDSGKARTAASDSAAGGSAVANGRVPDGPLRFRPHRLATAYGVHRAEAADLDGDGDLDIVACAFLDWTHRAAARYVGLLWLEQERPGEFQEHVLEAPECRHLTLSVGDYDADGDADLAVGNASLPGRPPESWVRIFENQGK